MVELPAMVKQLLEFMLLFEDPIDQFTNLGGSFCQHWGVPWTTTSSLQHANRKVDCALPNRSLVHDDR